MSMREKHTYFLFNSLAAVFICALSCYWCVFPKSKSLSVLIRVLLMWLHSSASMLQYILVIESVCAVYSVFAFVCVCVSLPV